MRNPTEQIYSNKSTYEYRLYFAQPSNDVMACLNLDFAAWQSLVWSWFSEEVVALQSVAVRRT